MPYKSKEARNAHLRNANREIREKRNTRQLNWFHEKGKQRRKENPPPSTLGTLRFAGQIKAKYGLSYSEYLELVKESGGHCLICNAQFDDRCSAHRPHIDHNHETGKVGGLLCPQCNFNLGKIEKDNWLDKAKEYILQYR